jgi:hypothetical protein
MDVEEPDALVRAAFGGVALLGKVALQGWEVARASLAISLYGAP